LRPNMSGSPTYNDALFGGAHLLCADLYLIDWLTVKGYAFDVVTDEDLHFEGHNLLKRYQVLVTGAHPEYWTKQMLDALRAYRDHGGRVMYLGGNGLYWVTSLDSELPVIEVRRSLGTSLSRAYDGEYYHNMTGEMGGMWRAQGQAPQKLLGVGLSAIGGAPGSPYRRQPDSFDPRAAFIFEGVDVGEVIGNFGLNTGAAAGFEIDRFDYSLGTPPDTLLLASSSDHDDSYWHVVEEVSNIGIHECGKASKSVRADMTFYQHPAGGAVFSVGSIAWTGSLSNTEYDNSVSTITENVLRRFLLEKPFGASISEKEGYTKTS
jgi:N,N-dimethylformamidase